MKSTFHINTSLIVLCFTIVVFVISSCNEKPRHIGATIQPNRDLLSVSFTDSAYIVAYSLPEDSIRTDATTEMLAGSIIDPIFGSSVAGFYSQFRLSTSGHSFGTNPVADSLVLQLAYKDAYGDTLSTQTVRVYELLEDIFVDSAYYSKSFKQTSTTDLANFSFAPRPKSTIVNALDTLHPFSPRIRIRLSDLSAELMDKLMHASATDIDSNNHFQEYFKGLYIVADRIASGGAISYFNIGSTESYLRLYHKNDEADSLSYTFYVTSYDEHYNVFNQFNYQNAEPALVNQVVNGDTMLGTSNLYMQAMSGIKTKIRFPKIAEYQEFVGKNIVINEAKLFLSGIEKPSTYGAPAQLILVKDDGDGTFTVLQDQLEGAVYFGGNYKSSVNEYQFRLTRYIQDLLINGKGNDDYGLLLFIPGASGKADRWKFNGTNPQSDTLKPLRLEVVYSIMN